MELVGSRVKNPEVKPSPMRNEMAQERLNIPPFRSSEQTCSGGDCGEGGGCRVSPPRS